MKRPVYAIGVIWSVSLAAILAIVRWSLDAGVFAGSQSPSLVWVPGVAILIIGCLAVAASLVSLTQ